MDRCLDRDLSSKRSTILAKRQKGRRRLAGGDSAVEAESVSAVYFLLPLEVPLSIPDRSIIRSQERPPPQLGFEDDYFAVEWDNQEGLVGCRISCCFHQITTTEIDAAQFAAFEAARVAFPSPQTADAPSEGPSLPAVVTVAEVAVRLAEHSEDGISRALDEAIQFVAEVQRAYGALASEPVAIMTRARLPLLVPYTVREVISGAHPSDWPDMAELEVVMPRAPAPGEYMSAPSAESPAEYSLEDLGTVGPRRAVPPRPRELAKREGHVQSRGLRCRSDPRGHDLRADHQSAVAVPALGKRRGPGRSNSCAP